MTPSLPVCPFYAGSIIYNILATQYSNSRSGEVHIFFAGLKGKGEREKQVPHESEKRYKISYPSEDWDDFGCVIIGWWASTVMRFLAGENEEEFSFMDGSYSISAKYNQNTEEVVLLQKKTSTIWKTKLRIIINNLISTVGYIYKILLDKNFCDEELFIIKKYLEALENCLLQLSCCTELS